METKLGDRAAVFDRVCRLAGARFLRRREPTLQLDGDDLLERLARRFVALEFTKHGLPGAAADDPAGVREARTVQLPFPVRAELGILSARMVRSLVLLLQIHALLCHRDSPSC